LLLLFAARSIAQQTFNTIQLGSKKLRHTRTITLYIRTTSSQSVYISGCLAAQ